MPAQDKNGVFVSMAAMSACGGNARNALLLSQARYYLDGNRGSRKGERSIVERGGHRWLCLTDVELAEDTGLSADQVLRARQALATASLVAFEVSSVEGRKVTLLRVLTGEEQTAESRNGDAEIDPNETTGSQDGNRGIAGDQTAEPQDANRDLAATKPRDRSEVAAESRNAPHIDNLETKKDVAPASPPRATDDPVVAQARRLATRAFEQPVKPLVQSSGGRGGNGFVVVMSIIEGALRRGVDVRSIERAIDAQTSDDPIAWSLAGLGVAISKSKPKGGSSALGTIQRMAAKDVA